MAHSHERTLLASLGFADPDKRDRRHTLACQYLCREDVALKLAEAVGITSGLNLTDRPNVEPVAFSAVGDSRPVAWEFPAWAYALRLKSGIIERPITKNRDYLVGFLDVELTYQITTTRISEKVQRRSQWRYQDEDDAWRDGMPPFWFGPERATEERVIYDYDFRPFTHDEVAAGQVAVEVKARPCDVGDIARQMALYGQHVPRGCVLVVATCWRMSSQDRATLRDKGIHTVHLGALFEAYCRDRANEAVDSDAVEL